MELGQFKLFGPCKNFYLIFFNFLKLSRGSIETHAIHLNNKYEEDDEALAAKDGVLILAHGLGKTELKDEIGDLDVLHEGVAKVREIGSSAKLPQLTLDEMGIKNARVFFVYEGSLTYPPCTENVIWLYSANGGIVTKSTASQ